MVVSSLSVPHGSSSVSSSLCPSLFLSLMWAAGAAWERAALGSVWIPSEMSRLFLKRAHFFLIF